MTTLQFARSSLLYDIANYAYIEAHKLDIDEDAPLRAHLLSDITAEGNVDRVSRVLAVIWAEVVNILSPYTDAEDHADNISDFIEAPDVYEITIDPPQWMSPAIVSLLAKLVHEYMVCRVLYDWLSITHPDYGKPWKQKTEDTLARIHALRISGSMPMVRKMPPF